MELQEFTQRLAVGELSNTALVDEGNLGMIREKHRMKVRDALNDALKALHSKFILIQKRVRIATIPEVSYYFLRKEFALSNTGLVPYKYIVDSTALPFEEDVIRIMSVYNSLNEAQFINDLGQINSIFTPEYDCIQVPQGRGTMYYVVYQANHPIILGTDPCQEIRVPQYLEEAVKCYVASKVFSQLNGAENQVTADRYMASFMSICNEVLTNDLASNSASTTIGKLEMRGFL